MINRDVTALYPPFARLISAFLALWNSLNPNPAQIFEGLRSFERQGELYAQGRTVAGPKVTNAMPGFSWHQYGLAVDIVFDADPVKPGLQATWDARFPWAKLGLMGAREFDLEWAGNWISFVETPHFQKTYGLQLSEAREIYEMDGGGNEAVWNALNLTRQVKLRGG